MEFVSVFPGQGSQSVGMMDDLAASYPIVKHTFQAASDAIETDLWALVVNGPAEQLNQTHNTQPIMLAASYSIWQILQQATSRSPQMMAGHSFGEVSALCCAQAIDFPQAVVLAHKRGQIMQQAVPQGIGAMAAILGLDDQRLIELCVQVSTDSNLVEAVNFNAPGQVVIAGHSQAVDELMNIAKQAGAKRALKLPVSVPAHSTLMRQAADKFAAVLADMDFTLPAIPVLQNTTLTSAQSAEAVVRGLTEQLYSPVPWVATIKTMQASLNCIIEIGPGKVLTGLHKRIDKTLTAMCIYDNASLESALTLIEE